MPISLNRIYAVYYCETRELWRDKVRLSICFAVPVLLMLIFGYGLNIDLVKVPFVVLDFDRSPESRDYIDHYTHSRYFEHRGVVRNEQEADRSMIDGKTHLTIEIPPNFGRDWKAGKQPQLGFWVDGSLPFRGDNIMGYVFAMHQGILNTVDPNLSHDQPTPTLQTRFWYNQTLESKYTFVPGLIAVNLITISAILSALAVVRERELGQIVNFYATPLSRVEFLCGKLLPYLLINLINALLLGGIALILFGIPFKGSILAFLVGSILYVLATTGLGLLIATLTKTQVSAFFITFILTMIPAFLNSGLLNPISSTSAGAQFLAHCYPIVYYLNICVGCFTKGLGFYEQIPSLLALAIIFLAFFSLSALFLGKQER